MENLRIIDRLDFYLEFKKLNDRQVYAATGLSTGLLSHARKRETPLSKSAINRILAAYPDLNGTWLRTGEGDMLRSDNEILREATEEMSGWQLHLEAIESLIRQNEKLIDLIKSMLQK